MFQRLFGKESRVNRSITDALYGEIVAAARQPVFYSHWNVPDTPLGRFEMLSLHMFLLQHRLRGEEGLSREIAQVLIDDFFTDVEHSLRELGIGDVGVPKRMKKLAKMFYGRTASYSEALDQGDKPALAAALARNVLPGNEDKLAGDAMAAYVIETDRSLATVPSAEIQSGSLEFPPAPDPDDEGGER